MEVVNETKLKLRWRLRKFPLEEWFFCTFEGRRSCDGFGWRTVRGRRGIGSAWRRDVKSQKGGLRLIVLVSNSFSRPQVAIARLTEVFDTGSHRHRYLIWIHVLPIHHTPPSCGACSVMSPAQDFSTAGHLLNGKVKPTPPPHLSPLRLHRPPAPAPQIPPGCSRARASLAPA